MSSGSDQPSPGPSPDLGRPSAPQERKVGRPRNMICDGTVADYRRHYRHGERPCAESKAAWYVKYNSTARAAAARRQRARVAEQKRKDAEREAARREREAAAVYYPEGKEGSAIYRLGLEKHLTDPRPPSTPEEIAEARKLYPYKEDK